MSLGAEGLIKKVRSPSGKPMFTLQMSGYAWWIRPKPVSDWIRFKVDSSRLHISADTNMYFVLLLRQNLPVKQDSEGTQNILRTSDGKPCYKTLLLLTLLIV